MAEISQIPVILTRIPQFFQGSSTTDTLYFMNFVWNFLNIQEIPHKIHKLQGSGSSHQCLVEILNLLIIFVECPDYLGSLLPMCAEANE